MLGFGRKKAAPSEEQSSGAGETKNVGPSTGEASTTGLDLERHHIADLHAVAAVLGVDGFRKLGRDQLISAISGVGTEKVGSALAQAVPSPTLVGEYSLVTFDRGGGAGQGTGAGLQGDSGPGRGSGSGAGRNGGGGGGRSNRGSGRQGQGQSGGRRSGGAGSEQRKAADPDRSRSDKRDDETPAEDETGEPVEGVLDLMPRRFGFLRLSGMEAADGDVYVSASQVRRCELRAGDWIAGPARPPRGKERHPALIHVDSVNGREPENDRISFPDLTPVAATRRLDLGSADTGSEVGDTLVRAVDLLSPIALGQRVLLHSGPRSGRTTLLRALASAIDSRGDEIATIILLLDERPEEATEWLKAVPDAELSITTAEQSATEHVRAAELALQRAHRQVEVGRDVVMLIDSLSRLAVAAEDTDKVKSIFGSGRDVSEQGGGSLTVIATVLDDGVEPDAAAAVLRTESNLIRLDSDLAAAGVTPALVVSESRVSDEDKIREDAELDAVRKLRSELNELDPAEAAKTLGERIAGSASNSELLG